VAIKDFLGGAWGHVGRFWQSFTVLRLRFLRYLPCCATVLTVFRGLCIPDRSCRPNYSVPLGSLAFVRSPMSYAA
jgi:hypothetical protein